MAKSAVMSAPDRAAASTTTTASARPATMRLRAGKRHGAGVVSGQYSLMTAPVAIMRCASAWLRLGCM